ncbi:MAG: hypothetical protein HYV63_15345 [Candidatus Schekmanbacteria bacterium]|nr:hypothetical protein [Candidatus Schekmanbacteria bacterium]
MCPKCGQPLALKGRFLATSQRRQDTWSGIFRGMDLAGGRACEIEVLTQASVSTWASPDVFTRWSATLASLDHPCFPRMVDAFVVEMGRRRVFAVVRELVDAPSLEEYVAAGQLLGEDHARHILGCALSLLDYLHHRAPIVLHGDLRPHRIHLSAQNDVCVTGPGTAIVGDPKEAALWETKDTYGYWAPELRMGRRVPATDLFALGASIIYSVSGMLPGEVVERAVRTGARSLAGVSEELEALLLALAVPDFRRRYATVDEVREDLANLSKAQRHRSAEILYFVRKEHSVRGPLSAAELLALPGLTPWRRIKATASADWLRLWRTLAAPAGATSHLPPDHAARRGLRAQLWMRRLHFAGLGLALVAAVLLIVAYVGVVAGAAPEDEPGRAAAIASAAGIGAGLLSAGLIWLGRNRPARLIAVLLILASLFPGYHLLPSRHSAAPDGVAAAGGAAEQASRTGPESEK